MGGVVVSESTLADAAAAPGLAVTVYKEIGNPPLLAGAEKLTTALPMPDAADTEVGAPGTIAPTGT